jgi:hypothetical protein
MGGYVKYIGWYSTRTRITVETAARVRILGRECNAEMSMTPNGAITKRNMPIDCISGERRLNRRYRIVLELGWTVFARGKVLLSGTGTTIDLSSGGILFQAGTQLPIGRKAILSVSWPVLLDNSRPIQLVVSGVIVRAGANRSALRTIQHEFRTAAVASSSLSAPRRPWAVGSGPDAFQHIRE